MRGRIPALRPAGEPFYPVAPPWHIKKLSIPVLDVVKEVDYISIILRERVRTGQLMYLMRSLFGRRGDGSLSSQGGLGQGKMELIQLGFGLLMLMLLGFVGRAVEVSSVIIGGMELKPVRLPAGQRLLRGEMGNEGNSPGITPIRPTPVGMRSLKTGSWIPR